MDVLASALLKLFPAGESVVDGERFEVNGLEQGCEPQNCQVLARGVEKTPVGYRREHFLVRSSGLLLFFRVCSCGHSLSYGEFALGQGVAAGKREQTKLEKAARERIAQVCVLS